MTDIALVNLAWQRGGNEALLHAACVGADVVLVIEALREKGKKVERLGSILPKGWSTNQVTSSPARAGSAVCWLNSTMNHRDDSLTRMSPKGDNVRERYLSATLLSVRGSTDLRRYGAAHAPLEATGVKDDFYRDGLRPWYKRHDHAIVGIDGNLPPRAVQDKLAGLNVKVYGAEVMSIIVPRNVEVTATRTQHHPASDHPIYRITTATDTTVARDWWNNI